MEALIRRAVKAINARETTCSKETLKKKQDIERLLEHTPFKAEKSLQNLQRLYLEQTARENEQFEAQRQLQIFNQIKDNPYSKEARAFWSSRNPISEFLAYSYFEDKRIPEIEELINFLTAQNVPMAMAVSATWCFRRKNIVMGRNILQDGTDIEDPCCLFLSARCLLNGSFDIPKDIERGRKLLLKSAEKGYPDAIRYLDVSLRRNSFGFDTKIIPNVYQGRAKNMGLPKECYTAHRDDIMDSPLWWLF